MWKMILTIVGGKPPEVVVCSGTDEPVLPGVGGVKVLGKFEGEGLPETPKDGRRHSHQK
jgi:hypothetical protein